MPARSSRRGVHSHMIVLPRCSGSTLTTSLYLSRGAAGVFVVALPDSVAVGAVSDQSAVWRRVASVATRAVAVLAPSPCAWPDATVAGPTHHRHQHRSGLANSRCGVSTSGVFAYLRIHRQPTTVHNDARLMHRACHTENGAPHMYGAGSNPSQVGTRACTRRWRKRHGGSGATRRRT